MKWLISVSNEPKTCSREWRCAHQWCLQWQMQDSQEGCFILVCPLPFYVYIYVCVISFTVNGTQHTVNNADPAMNLNEWIRNQPGLQGKSHIELNIIFGKSHTTAFLCLVLFFNGEKKFYLK